MPDEDYTPEEVKDASFVMRVEDQWREVNQTIVFDNEWAEALAAFTTTMEA